MNFGDCLTADDRDTGEYLSKFECWMKDLTLIFFSIFNRDFIFDTFLYEYVCYVQFDVTNFFFLLILVIFD